MEQWPWQAKLAIGLLVLLNAMGAIGDIATWWAPTAISKDAKISIQRDEIEALKSQLRRLEEHRAALDQYERTREQWEREKTEERRFRQWQTQVLRRLDERCSDDS